MTAVKGSAEHTLVPWEVVEYLQRGKKLHHLIQNKQQVKIVELPVGVDDYKERNDARFIVRACNSHDALLAACKETLDYIEENIDLTPTTAGLKVRLRSAISQAEKGE